MCGIVSVIRTNKEVLKKDNKWNKGYGSKSKSHKVFEQLLFSDTLRGFHGTGIIGYDGKDYSSYKKGLSAPDFLQLNKTTEIIRTSEALIGHNRWATMGSHTDTNSHPFEYGDFIGVHNGTLSSWFTLPSAMNFDVDSEYIYYSFDKFGIDTTLERLNGAYALVFFNKKENTFNIIRNHERPISVKEYDDGDNHLILLSSEEKMLDWIASRNSLTYHGEWKIEPHKHYYFNMNNSHEVVLNEKKVPKYVPPKRQENSHYYYNGYNPSYYINKILDSDEKSLTFKFSVFNDKLDEIICKHKAFNKSEYQRIKNSVSSKSYILGVFLTHNTVSRLRTTTGYVNYNKNSKQLMELKDEFNYLKEYDTDSKTVITKDKGQKLVDCEFCGNPSEPEEVQGNFIETGFKLCDDCVSYAPTSAYK